ncbi:unnamed protein product (macronuclear) [Paramecium tetraurelia]|uniref:Uncharacterized protein n=1 Tax=Paramecium tetraurelia TaxID=5888 RepID=A0DEM4_PARTE|nr:uncharacterized protein GSPATT00016317001 [Paramecium tetraurelia]CAK81491.1 unnamed protein product [Paramecium tetraurelia]|eukprot:XP_001448888.1 hypothetical protein (macronuclear) [Paramecium tetraurelia strain d4-2]
MNVGHRLKFQISVNEDEINSEIITLNQFDAALKFEDRYKLDQLGCSYSSESCQKERYRSEVSKRYLIKHFLMYQALSITY